MSHEVLERIQKIGPRLAEQADSVEAAGRLPDETAAMLKESGVVRLLQPASHGGYEAAPTVFFEAVMAIARHCGASGWVSGIIGVHPWQLAMCDPRVRDEVWGEDPDSWMASTYMPGGFARPVDGGFDFTGRWQFSSGCDVSDWVILGGVIVDGDPPEAGGGMAKLLADPSKYVHVIVPRSDVTIIEGTWDVVGLSGTGSKDVAVEGAFVPSYRTMLAADVVGGTAAGLEGCGPLYRMPWGGIFPNAITAAVIGIAEGALEAALAFQGPRISMASGPIVKSPVTMTAIGEAASEIESCRIQLLDVISKQWEYAQRGEPIPLELRARSRRDQVRTSWRATRAVDSLFDHAGGGALRRGTPLQRLWRDAHAGLHHIINVREKVPHSYASVALGHAPVDAML
jgi:3-hydroxy-9,10-secoandrosta-1,3,5(10)-triene-9,17-dione monooxygenase